MRNKALETQLRLLTLQLDNWKKVHDLITYGLDKAKPIISAEQERQFTETRANLLQETEHVFRELGILGELSGRAMNFLNRGVSMRGVREMSNEDVRRLEAEWNSVFTKLGVLQGQLKSKRKALVGRDSVFLLYRRPLSPAGRCVLIPESSQSEVFTRAVRKSFRQKLRFLPPVRHLVGDLVIIWQSSRNETSSSPSAIRQAWSSTRSSKSSSGRLTI